VLQLLEQKETMSQRKAEFAFFYEVKMLFNSNFLHTFQIVFFDKGA